MWRISSEKCHCPYTLRTLDLSPVRDFPPLFPLSSVYVFLLPFLLLCFSLILCLPCFQEALSGSSPDNFLKSLCFPPLSYRILTSIFPVSKPFYFKFLLYFGHLLGCDSKLSKMQGKNSVAGAVKWREKLAGAGVSVSLLPL